MPSRGKTISEMLPASDLGSPDQGFPPGVSRAKNLQLQKMMPSLRNDTKGATIVHISFHRKPRKSKPDTDWTMTKSLTIRTSICLAPIETPWTKIGPKTALLPQITEPPIKIVQPQPRNPPPPCRSRRPQPSRTPGVTPLLLRTATTARELHRRGEWWWAFSTTRGIRSPSTSLRGGNARVTHLLSFYKSQFN
jgi:hypothetical protein